MFKEILDPLSEYESVFRPRFEEVAKNTFDELAKEAQVDEEANKDICKKYYDALNLLDRVNKKITLLNILCYTLWLLVIIGVFYVSLYYKQLEIIWSISISLAVALFIFILFWKIHPNLKRMKKGRDNITEMSNQYKDMAWGQMQGLNNLYDWDILMRMMSQTIPSIQFDPYFTTQRLADLKMTYNWDDSFNDERSVIYSHSGLIKGNPFVICRTRKMIMGNKQYTGTKYITWTTRELGSDGKYHTVHHSQTLVATVTAPYPEYFEKTRLIYGNIAAPDLIFDRYQSGLASYIGSSSFKQHRKSLRKKSQDLKNYDYAMLTNEEFEVSFDTSNRNNNHQFSLLFTPLAQDNIMKLLQDKCIGYGDDFDFHKCNMINIIEPQHMQNLVMDMDPRQFAHFDFEKAKENFKLINANYFRAIYFSLAPLLCIPMYQQIRPQEDIYGRDMKKQSSFWEHEALANFWGENNFKHKDCVTLNILKTEENRIDEQNSKIKVYAYGYRAEKRVSYVSKWGGDGRLHNVPVYWDEYIPVVGNGYIQIKEDNEFKDENISNKERLNYLYDVLDKSNLSIYRRHIASKI